MPAEITMPQLSDTMTEGTVVKWLKKEGDKVRQGDIIAEVETDKATMEMESFDSGTLARQIAREGDKVKVGDLIGVLARSSENLDDVKKQFAAASPAASKAAASQAVPAAVTASVGAQESETDDLAESDEVGHPAGAPSGGPTPPAPHDGNGGRRLRVSPLARRMAREMGVDLAAVTGTGPGGRIVRRDLEAAAVAAPPKPAEAPAALPVPGKKEIVPLTKMRAAIAKNLQLSKQSIPHFYETIDVDVEDLSKLRVRMNEMLEPQKVRLSLGDFIAKAVATALQRHPALNSTFNGAELTRFSDVHLGMAVAIPDGLIVPVLRNIHTMGLKEIRLRSMDLVERARAQRLKQDEMSGGTFTVSNLGTFGIREFSAIINPPQVGILAVAAAEKRPVIRGDAIIPRTMMTLTLSADHRVVDGATAAEFLRTLKGLLEEPGMMLV